MGWPDSGGKNEIIDKRGPTSGGAACERDPSGRTHKTVVPLLLQHVGDVVHATHGELVVVELVPRRGSGIHDVVALLLHVLAFGFSWCALGSGVMLGTTQESCQTRGDGDKARRLLKPPHVHQSDTSCKLTGEPKLWPTSCAKVI